MKITTLRPPKTSGDYKPSYKTNDKLEDNLVNNDQQVKCLSYPIIKKKEKTVK